MPSSQSGSFKRVIFSIEKPMSRFSFFLLFSDSLKEYTNDFMLRHNIPNLKSLPITELINFVSMAAKAQVIHLIFWCERRGGKYTGFTNLALKMYFRKCE